jgi:hypothetical protein
VALGLVTVHLVLAAISGYRAIVQIYRVDVSAPPRAIRTGDVVSASIVSSGRTEADVQLELIQGTHAETLGVRYLPRNREGVYDFRPQRAALSATLSAERLARFHAGAASLRATGYGSRQWLRVPPPVVREVAVQLAPMLDTNH